VEASVDSDRLPFALAVTWEDGDGTHKAGWPVNVDDPSALSSVDELRGLPADLLIAVLASNRPIRDALEEALRRANRQQAANHAADLDPLKRLHDPNLLLPRTRRVSEALWMLGKRLSRPLTSLDALEWRLRGPVGPCALAAAWVAASNDGGLLAGEAEFLLAELALTLSRVPWREAAASCPPAKVQSAAAGVIRDLAGLRGKLPAAAKAEGGLKTYVDAAFAEALR
jgi:hypothetical protein